MGKAVLASVVTLAAGVLTMSVFYETLEIGVLVSIAVMGAFIIYYSEKKNK